MQGDARALDPLIPCLAAEEETSQHRAMAAYAIKQLVVDRGNTRPDLARALESGLRHDDCELRFDCLQALFEVRAPVSLDLLLACMVDLRPAYPGAEFRIADNALWIFCRQIGMEVHGRGEEGTLGRCSPELLAYLRDWHARVESKLRWDPEQQRYATPR